MKEEKIALLNKLQSQLKNKEKWILSSEDDHFKFIQVSILKKLQLDSFPRFIRKESLRKIFSQRTNEEQLFSLKKNEKFYFTDEDFLTTIVTDFDIHFMENLKEDNLEWKLIYSNIKTNSNTFKLKKSPFFDVSFFQDSFPRFIRTIVVEKFKEYKSVASLIEIYDSKYNNETFLKPVITEMDIEFAKKLMEDDYNWELMYSNTKMQLNTFLMEKSYFPNVSFLKNSKILKIEIILPYAFQTCVNEFSSIDQLKNIERMIVDIDIVSYLSSNETKEQFSQDVDVQSTRGNAIYWQSTKLNSISKMRKSLNVATSFYENGIIFEF